MAVLTDQFKTAKSNVEPSEGDKDEAPARHEEVRDELAKSEVLKAYGLVSVLIGSYRRQVSIRRVKDVDVFCKLEKLLDIDPDLSADELMEHFEKALHDTVGEDRVRPQDRSFQVSFAGSDMFVDVVGARRCDDHWEIPDGNGGWQETNPEKLKTLTEAMNAEHGEHYVPTVKLVRQTRRAHLGDQPGGLFFEVATYHAFESGEVAGANTAEYFCTTLERLPTELQAAIDDGLADPSLSGQLITTRATTTESQTALTVFQGLASKARDALDEIEPCRSARLWREILGENGDGWVFDMPEGCNEDGTAAVEAPIRAGLTFVPGGDKKFA